MYAYVSLHYFFRPRRLLGVKKRIFVFMQAMRAVLDRPLRANFVSVSTALNRVAKLAAKRSRGGGLVNDEERKYLGILIKVCAVLVG